MNKLIVFLSGLVIMVIMFITLLLTSGIYNTASQQYINVYFFQPNRNSISRPGVPLSNQELGDDEMRNMLISRYVTEYFYVQPTQSSIDRRAKSNSILAFVSDSSVFKQWERTVLPELTALSNRGVMRTVHITNIQPYGDNWVVDYYFKTWLEPNNMNEVPQITHGQVLLQIIYENELRQWYEDTEHLHEIIENNIDPFVTLTFSVAKVVQL